MSQLLYIEASPRKKRSASIEVANEFLHKYNEYHPGDLIHSIDLWHKPLPSFDGDVIDSKYAIMQGQSHTEAQRKAWRAVEEIIHEFKAADKYLFSIPMWNFGIPYILKHYIDLLVQPNYAFTYSPSEGYKGLVVNKPVLLIYARGGAYGSGTGGESYDLQKTYMESILRFIGFTDIRSILVEPTGASHEQKDQAIANAKTQAVTMAEIF